MPQPSWMTIPTLDEGLPLSMWLGCIAEVYQAGERLGIAVQFRKFITDANA